MLDSDLVIYYSQIFFGFEAVFLGLVMPKTADKLTQIKSYVTDPNVSEAISGALAKKIIRNISCWSYRYPRINDYCRKFTIISLAIGMPVVCLLYFLVKNSLWPSGGPLIYLPVTGSAAYMVLKLFYYGWQFVHSSQLLRDFELISSWRDEGMANVATMITATKDPTK